MQAEIIKFDEFELDLGRYELRRQGQPLKLEKIPMELLILLAERDGQLVTREEIIRRLWGDNVYVDTRQGVNTAIRKIRLALKDDPDEPRILLTVVGKGYRLVAPIMTIAPSRDVQVPESGGTVGSGPAGSELGALNAGMAPEAAAHLPPAEAGPQPDALRAVAAVVDAGLARVLFMVIQAGYLTLYGAAFSHLPQIRGLPLPAGTAEFTLIAGLVGAAVHLYMIAAVAFNFPGSARLFRQIFPGILAIDVVWAASPLFLFERWGEITLLFVAAMAFLPFSQRTLIRCAYGFEGYKYKG